MSKIIKNFLLIFSLLLTLISCTYDIKDINLNEEKRGSLTNDESDYFKITLPAEINKNGTIVFELEPNLNLDRLNYIVSDPNLYISIDESHPNALKNTWASNRFGGEIITIGESPTNFLYRCSLC